MGVCLYMSVLHQQMPWNWASSPDPLEEKPVLLPDELSFQPGTKFLSLIFEGWGFLFVWFGGFFVFDFVTQLTINSPTFYLSLPDAEITGMNTGGLFWGRETCEPTGCACAHSSLDTGSVITIQSRPCKTPHPSVTPSLDKHHVCHLSLRTVGTNRFSIHFYMVWWFEVKIIKVEVWVLGLKACLVKYMYVMQRICNVVVLDEGIGPLLLLN